MRAELAKRLAPLLVALRPIEVGLRNLLARRGLEASIKEGVDGILRAKPLTILETEAINIVGLPLVSTQTH